MKRHLYEGRTLRQWSQDSRCQVDLRTLQKRAAANWSLHDAIFTPLIKPPMFEAFDESKGLKEWSRDKRCVVGFRTLNSRINGYHWNLEKALTEPKNPTVEISPKELAVKGLPKRSTWYNMNKRCHKATDEHYPAYGARGIYVCDEWRSGRSDGRGFKNFCEWVEKNPRPSKSYTLDRENNDGPYSPENCRWATYIQQANNRRPVCAVVAAKKDLIINSLKQQLVLSREQPEDLTP